MKRRGERERERGRGEKGTENATMVSTMWEGKRREEKSVCKEKFFQDTSD